MNGVDQLIDFNKTVILGNICQVSIASGSFRGGMPEYSLDMSETQAALKQVCCEAVTKGMDMDFFLMPHSLTTTCIAF